MFSRLLAFCSSLLCVLIWTGVAHCAVPPMVSYQGKLMQPNGSPVPDGVYSLRFAIYDAPTGGNTLWSETNPSVAVKGGHFSAMLGSVINLPANVFDHSSRYFGVTVGMDPELTPRQQVGSVPYAIKAANADIAQSVIDGAITANKLAPGVAIPPGTILMWSGDLRELPQGWALCDGDNGTPNLRNRFIVGAGDAYAVGNTGGSDFHKLTIAEMPRHNHFLAWEGFWAFGAFTDNLGGSGRWAYHLPKQYTDDTGGDQPHENRPPYYALCFIMKLKY